MPFLQPSEPQAPPQPHSELVRDARGFLGLEAKWWVLIAVGSGTFMSALDTSVVNTILPVIQSTFGTEIATVEWVVIIYLLLVSALLPSFGRLGDLRGHKSIYLGGYFAFVLSSVLCGLSPSVWVLIVFRGVQALGAAMLSANSPAILTNNFPGTQRGQALGLQATMTYLGLTVGPSLGGWLAEQFTWRAVFYINIPVGILALLFSYFAIPRDAPGEKVERFDLAGALIFMAGLVALLLGLNQGHNWGWTSPAILALLASAAVLLSIFVVYELRVPQPMLDLRLFKRRLFSASVASAVFNYICVYSIIFLLPFYLIQGRGLNPAQAGLFLTAQPIIMAVAAPISGTLSDRIGVRVPSTLGMTILTGGLLLLSRLGPDTPSPVIVLSLAVSGLGIGIFISPNNSALMGSAPLNRRGIAAGILATARNVGMVLGVGLAGAVFTTVLSHSPQGGAAIYQAIQASLLAAAAVAGLGVLTTAIRGNTKMGENTL